MIVGQKNYYQGRQSSDPQLVEKLLQQRSVSKERAESLLLKAHNDLELAIRLYDRVNRHRNNVRQNRSGSSTPSAPSSANLSPYRPEDYSDEYGRLTPSSSGESGIRSPPIAQEGASKISDICISSGNSSSDFVDVRSYHGSEIPQPDLVEHGDHEQPTDNISREPAFQHPIPTTLNHNGQMGESPNEPVEQQNHATLSTLQASRVNSERPPVKRKPLALEKLALPNGHSPIQAFPSPSNDNERITSQTYENAADTPLLENDEPEMDGSEAKLEEWDFNLPLLTGLFTLIPDVDEGQGSFSLSDLAAALQLGADIQLVKTYLERFDPKTVSQTINDDVAGFPAMFYVVATNDEQILRLWLRYGGNPRAIHKPSGVPLLAFAVVNGMNMHANTTLIVATLLSVGASPDVIPKAFYSPYLEDLADGGPNEAALTDLEDENKRWCMPATRERLSKAINLSQRYYLDKASKMKESSVRQVELARRRKAQGLLGLPYFLIGQSLAANFLVQNLLLHLAEARKRPLVLTFAGPSGHGKTELARRLGALLSLEMQIVDCTIYNHEMELFGPRAPYVGADRGSPLNNFLARNDGQRCIVFLDEFEKTTSDIHKALLIPFDNGEYQDRRHLTTIDCSQTIWILATNAHDTVIQDFCSSNHKTLFVDDEEDEKVRLTKKLAKEIRQDFLRTFGSPLTGRVSGFVPFLPFSLGEQAVVVHKYIQELGQSIREPVNLTEGPEERLVGNVRLHIRRDATVCKTLADQEYHSDLGARSLIMAVDSIRRLIFQVYFDIDEELIVGDVVSDFYITAEGGEVVIKRSTPKAK